MRLEELLLENLSKDRNADCYWWNGNWYTCGDLLNLVDNCENALRRAGFEHGQRLVVMLRNSPLIPALSLAVWKLRGIFCPLNEKAGLSSLKGTLELLKPFAVILQNEIKELAVLKESWVCITCDLNAKDLPEFTGKLQEPDNEDFAVIFSTSGTSGNPKAVPLTHGNFLSNCADAREVVTDLQKGHVFLNVLPNFHSFGFTCTMLLPFSMNRKIAIVPSFLPPQSTMRAIIEAKVDVMYIVPAIIAYLLMSVEKGKFPVEELKRQVYICTGGDRLNPNVQDQAWELLGKEIVDGYGLTETSPIVCMTPSHDRYKLGTAGILLPGYEYKLKTRDAQELGKDSHEGVLWVKGASVTPGYFHAPEITAERFDSDGFFNTGDYVEIDSDGYIKIIDRVTDIIIVGGFNVYPQEVEKILSEHPAVQNAIVVGVPHAINGEVPKAFIQRREGFLNVTDREIIKFAKERMAHFKVPRSIEFVDDVPLSGTGKVLRRVLREKAGHKGI